MEHHSEVEAETLDNSLVGSNNDDCIVSANAIRRDVHNEDDVQRDCQLLLQSGLSDNQKLDIILNFNKYNPPATFCFPTKLEYGKNRSFQHHYLQMFPWLGYSTQLDGCLCLPCCLFSLPSTACKNFVQKPYSNWTKLNEKVKAHSSSSVHLTCALALESYKDAQSGKQPTIDTAFNQSQKRNYELNCEKLNAIIGCVILCGKQNIPFRGHNDSDSSESCNKGNFKAILEYRAQGDSVLQKHLIEGAKNAQYTSSKTQNLLIKMCGSLILDKIGADVKENGLFSIICDECTDCANKEQLSMSIRYVARDSICESFVGFYELSDGVTGEAISSTIEKAISDCHLDPSLLRGQAYDGASNMSGQYKGCAALIQQKYPMALYSHCCSHVLNLAVVKSCDSIQVRNLFAVMTKVYHFFDNHPKRQYVLDKICEDSAGKLKSLCKTRWLQRIDAFHSFMDLFDSIVKSFEYIVSNRSEWSRDAVLDAVSLSKAILEFEFIIALHVVERYLSYTEGLTRALQGRALDIVGAIRHIDVLKQVLTDTRSDIDRQFHAIFENASRCAGKHNVHITIPRICGRQTARDNHPAASAEEYFRRSLAIPFLDHLTSEIEARFSKHTVVSMKCLSIIPSCFSESAISDDELLEFFNPECKTVAKAELEIWRSNFKGQEKDLLPNSPESSLKFAKPMIFPNIRKMLVHVMVLPVTSCEAERSFSTLRRVKSYLRTTMTNERLTGLALLNIHGSTSYLPSIDTVRAEFLKKNRRLMETSKL